MGTGASASLHRQDKLEAPSSRSTGQQVVERDAVASAAAAAEGGVIWLISAIDKEKTEKEWLANRYEWLQKRYDEKCKEVESLQAELATFRASSKQPSQVKSASTTSEIVRGMAPPVVEKAMSDNAPWASSAPLQNSGQSGVGSNCGAAGGSGSADTHSRLAHSSTTPIPDRLGSPSSPTLKERRKMNLKSIEVANRKPPGSRAGEAPAVEAPAAASIAENDPPKDGSNTQRSGQSEESTGGPIVHSLSRTSVRFVEPQSALLRRRCSTWGSDSMGPTRSLPLQSFAAPCVDPVVTSEAIVRLDSKKDVEPTAILKVSNEKIVSMSEMDPDCPCSPKRAGKVRRGNTSSFS
jgi:hypothetical protein